MLVVCDTTPINYLLQIERIDLLPRLFGYVYIPPAVHRELLHPGAPQRVRDWAAALPAWVAVHEPGIVTDPQLLALELGEQQAIALAESLHADFLLTDDGKACRTARLRGLPILTTLLLLDAAADRGWLSFPDELDRLLATNFRSNRLAVAELLEKHSRR